MLSTFVVCGEISTHFPFSIDGYELKKKRRHGVRDDAMGDFPAYIDSFLAHHELIGAEKRTADEHKALLLSLYHQQESQLKLVEPFTRLQCHLQPVIESLILSDRFAFLQEQGFVPRILKVFDDAISPRCWAFLVQR